MTPVFYEFHIFEGFMWGLVLALLGIVAIWAVIELATWVFPRIKGGIGTHPDRGSFPRFLHNRHSN